MTLIVFFNYNKTVEDNDVCLFILSLWIFIMSIVNFHSNFTILITKVMKQMFLCYFHNQV